MAGKDTNPISPGHEPEQGQQQAGRPPRTQASPTLSDDTLQGELSPLTGETAHAALLGDPRLSFSANTVPRITLMNRLQRLYGNRHVQRLLIQRTPSAEVPSLSAETVSQVNAFLAQGNAEAKQQATNTMVDALIAAGSIHAQRLVDGRVRYQPGFAPQGGGYGLTSLSPGTAEPRPCIMRLGDGAFSSASVLYSTIMHEYQHVNQFWERTGGSENVHEIQAYLYEIEQMDQSGLGRNLTQLSFMRQQIVAYWNRATAEERQPYQQRYDRALQSIETRVMAIQTGGYP